MTPAFVVRFGTGRARRYLAQAPVPPGPVVAAAQHGWRPLIWVRDITRAEIFGSREAAHAFALSRLGHALWDVAITPWRGIPTDDLGGTPAAVRLAA